MTKNDVHKAIDMLQNDEEIESFVKSRIQELEDNSVETTVGQNYTTTFREYISQKTHYKPGERLKDAECPDLVYDDLTPYIDLVSAIKRNGGYDSFSLFTSIFFDVYNYLPSEDNGTERAFTYLSNKDKRVSIKQISEEACAFCSEKAGMAHNLFKFMGIDSEVVCGYRDSKIHAYNILYPRGYDNEPIVLYDPSFFVSFNNENVKQSYAYYQILKKDDYEKLLAGEPIKIDLTETESQYRTYYNLGSEFSFKGETSLYSAGLDRKKSDYTPRINKDAKGRITVDIDEIKKNPNLDLSERMARLSEDKRWDSDDLSELALASIKQEYEYMANSVPDFPHLDFVLEQILDGHDFTEEDFTKLRALELKENGTLDIEENAEIKRYNDLRKRIMESNGITADDFNELCQTMELDSKTAEILQYAFQSKGLIIDSYLENDSHQRRSR